MSKQTINIGASPNDGTGTPLRTSFDYTNQNFTELYTAVGPSGNNIVVPGNATITGDLTVDTSTLKVDSTNDRVGIGTASPAQFVHLSKSNTSTALTSPPVGGASLRIQNSSSTNNNFGSVEFYNAAGLFGASVNCQYTNQATPTNDLVFVTRGSSGGLEHYRIAADGVATWSEVGGVAGTAMTLNSTGLGIGASPSYPLHVQRTSFGVTALFLTQDGTSNPRLAIYGSSSGTTIQNTWSSGASNLIFANGGSVGSGTEMMRIDSSGNVGIGNTPTTAWRAGARALQVGVSKYVSLHEQSNGSTNLAFSNYESAANVFSYTTGDAPTRYAQINGVHQWFTAAAGTANTVITFTQAMTLDASGNLLVGTTSGSFRGQFAVASGADRNIFTAQVTGASNGLQVLWNHATTTLRIVLSNIPTSAAGLAAGTLWNDAGTIKIA